MQTSSSDSTWTRVASNSFQTPNQRERTRTQEFLRRRDICYANIPGQGPAIRDQQHPNSGLGGTYQWVVMSGSGPPTIHNYHPGTPPDEHLAGMDQARLIKVQGDVRKMYLFLFQDPALNEYVGLGLLVKESAEALPQARARFQQLHASHHHSWTGAGLGMMFVKKMLHPILATLDRLISFLQRPSELNTWENYGPGSPDQIPNPPGDMQWGAAQKVVAKKKSLQKVGRTRGQQGKHKPGQVIETKSGKRYIVDQSGRYVPLSSTKHARRGEAQKKRTQSRVTAPRAGTLQIINGQTYVVGEDRKTYIPITPSAAAGRGVLTTLLEIAAVVLIADLVIDLIVDDVILDDLDIGNAGFGNSGFGDMGFLNSGNGWNAGGFFY